jgi:hypothetical protein
MAIASSAPVIQWEFDTRVFTPDTAELRGVRTVAADEAWAVGSVVTKGAVRALVGRWMGDFRFIDPAPADPQIDVRLFGVDLAGDEVWAVGTAGGRPRIERYSRSSGSVAEAVAGLAADRDGALHGVVMLSDSQGWAVGGAAPGSGASSTRTLIARWDGIAWSTVPSPSPGAQTNRLAAVAARSKDDVWAVGHSTGGDRSDALVLHWDGTAWTQVPVPAVPAGAELLGVAVTGRDAVWAVGTGVDDRTPGKPVRHVALALHWDGSAWHSVQFGQTPVTQLSAVTALSETDVWFAGYAELPGGPETAHIEHWDGLRMRAEGSGATGQDNVASALSGISAAAGHLMAVGWRTTSGIPNQLPAALLGRTGA